MRSEAGRARPTARPRGHPIPQGLEEPQGQQAGAAGAPAALSAPTAKTLSARAVWLDPHSGHLTFVSLFIERTSCSNFASHRLQAYS